MSHAVAIETTINQRPMNLSVLPRVTLAEMLRDQLGLTGTKISCGMQVCGVCTVLVDGDPVSACTFLAVDIDGQDVTTIEGIGTSDELHPVQQAFVDHFALQCGFCTPGFVMMTIALLGRDPNPSEEDIVEYLDGNICRCTGYRSIVDAVLAVKEQAE